MSIDYGDDDNEDNHRQAESKKSLIFQNLVLKTKILLKSAFGVD